MGRRQIYGRQNCARVVPKLAQPAFECTKKGKNGKCVEKWNYRCLKTKTPMLYRNIDCAQKIYWSPILRLIVNYEKGFEGERYKIIVYWTWICKLKKVLFKLLISCIKFPIKNKPMSKLSKIDLQNRSDLSRIVEEPKTGHGHMSVNVEANWIEIKIC